MARMATRIATGLATAGIATIMFAAPAHAQEAIDAEGGGGCTGTACAGPLSTSTSQATRTL